MNKLKYFFLLILCFGAVSNISVVSAQTGDQVLVTGKHQLKQSDIKGLIDFYEWLLEAKFSADQREKFQIYTIREFRANPAENRQTIDEMNNTMSQILATPAGEQAETRKKFLAYYLSNARKNTDENSKMLLSIYETARSGNAQASAESEETETMPRSSNSGSATQSLVGKWTRSEGSGYIDHTGKTQHKAGKHFMFEFFPDGTVEYVYSNDVLSIIQCRTKETAKARGTVKISGDTMTINLGPLNAVGSSTCEKNDNFNRTSPASTITKKFTIKKLDSITRPDKPTMLCFDGQEGTGCFEKSTK
jgi:hypothetical protein